MVTIVGVLLGLTLLYFWLRGHWFAAVVAMLAVWAGPGLLLMSALDSKVPAIVGLPLIVATGAVAWIPWAIRRAMTRPRQAAPVIAPQPISGISLVGRDASFNG